MMTVTSKQEAWNKVNEIFPTDYEQDMGSSDRAGYPSIGAPLRATTTTTSATWVAAWRSTGQQPPAHRQHLHRGARHVR